MVRRGVRRRTATPTRADNDLCPGSARPIRARSKRSAGRLGLQVNAPGDNRDGEPHTASAGNVARMRTFPTRANASAFPPSVGFRRRPPKQPRLCSRVSCGRTSAAQFGEILGVTHCQAGENLLELGWGSFDGRDLRTAKASFLPLLAKPQAGGSNCATWQTADRRIEHCRDPSGQRAVGAVMVLALDTGCGDTQDLCRGGWTCQRQQFVGDWVSMRKITDAHIT
jgi:hypothetical protein